MTPRQGAALGIYSHQMDAEGAVQALKIWGYRHEDISAVIPDPDLPKIVTMEGSLRWLGGKRTLVIPGIGPARAAGPILTALAGVSSGDAIGLAGALVSLDIPLDEARRYESRVKNGGILLCVHGAGVEWTVTAKEILEQTGAEDVAALVPDEN